MTWRTLGVGITLWLFSLCWSPAQEKAAPVFTPAGPSAREIVGAGIDRLNADPSLQLPSPPDENIVQTYRRGFVPKSYHNNRVRWQGTVVENVDKKSKVILVLVGDFQAPGQTFKSTVGVNPRPDGPVPGVGEKVWIEGVVSNGDGWISVRRVDQQNVTIGLPGLLSNARLLGDPAAKPAPPVDSAAKMEQEASSRLNFARTLADNGKVDRARERCQEILKLYPKTKAAEEARQFLEKLNKK